MARSAKKTEGQSKGAVKKTAQKANVKAGKTAPVEQNAKKPRDFYVDVLCTAIANSDKGMATWVKIFQKDDEHFPSVPTFLRWLNQEPAFLELYTRARESQADFLADQMLEICDDDSLDVAFKDDGTPFHNTEHINRTRLRVDTRKWIASKLKPKKYGDKIAVAGDADNPLVVKSIFDEETAKRMAQVLLTDGDDKQ